MGKYFSKCGICNRRIAPAQNLCGECYSLLAEPVPDIDNGPLRPGFGKCMLCGRGVNADGWCGCSTTKLSPW